MAGADGAARYASRVWVFGLVFGAAFLVCAVLAFRSATGGPVVAGAFVLFASPGLYLAADCWGTAVWVDPDGLRFRFLLKGRRAARWHEMRRIEWSPALMWFVIHTQEGQKLRISGGLLGLQRVAQALLTHVGEGRIDETAQERLELTAAGNAPSLWE